MRGVAVLLVVLFHCNVPAFRGGFIGVDVFFALSGYLITGLIVNEVERNGKLSFRTFYARRVRRLLPAAGLVIVSTLVFGTFVYSPLELARYVKWSVHTSLYVSNYMFIRAAANYFASDIALNPYLHTWSLAVEEQFYLFWPLLIAASLVFLKSKRALEIVLTVLCLLSFATCMWLTRTRQPWAFFSLPTRAWEFALAGLASQLSMQKLQTSPRLVNAVIGWVGFAIVIASGCLYSSQMNFPGYLALFPILGTVAVLIAGASGVRFGLQVLLASHPLQYLGMLSYSWYLWHWPMLLMAEACFPTLTWRGRLLPAIIALLLAQITFWIVENPVRMSSFLVPRPAYSLSIALVVGLLGLSAAKLVEMKVYLELKSPEQATLWAAAHDTRTLFDAHCLVPAGEWRVKECYYGDRDSNITVALFGDSHAEHWFPALNVIANDRHWRIITLLKSSCPVARVEVYNSALGREDAECHTWREAALSTIIKESPRLVILSEKDAVVANISSAISHKVSPSQWEEGLHSTVSYLDVQGIKTLLIADTPRARSDIPTCLSRAAAHSWASSDCIIHRNLAINLEALKAESSAVKDIPRAMLVDFAETFCPGETCEATAAGKVIYRDSNHMASSFAKGLAPLLTQKIDYLLSPPQNKQTPKVSHLIDFHAQLNGGMVLAPVRRTTATAIAMQSNALPVN